MLCSINSRTLLNRLLELVKRSFIVIHSKRWITSHLVELSSDILHSSIYSLFWAYLFISGYLCKRDTCNAKSLLLFPFLSTEPALHASDQLLGQQTQRELWARWDGGQRQQEVHQLVHRVPPHQWLWCGQILGRRLCTWAVHPKHVQTQIQLHSDALRLTSTSKSKDVEYDNKTLHKCKQWMTSSSEVICTQAVTYICVCIHTHAAPANNTGCTQCTSGRATAWYDLLWQWFCELV